jgi:hypothetical protein
LRNSSPLICFLILVSLIAVSQNIGTPLAFAQTVVAATTPAHSGPHILRGTEAQGAIHAWPQEIADSLKKIYSNLGKTKGDLYQDNVSWTLSGPKSEAGYTQFVGMPFTPASDSHVTEVEVAVQYGGAGANQIDLSIYEDREGAPGTLIGGPVTVAGLPDFLTCCTLTVADFPPVSVTGSKHYWVVANTPSSGKGSDFYGGWDFIPSSIAQALDNGTGWTATEGFSQEAAGAVYGTIP